MATQKRIEHLTLAEVEKAVQENEAERRILIEIREKKKQEEYADLCRQIAEFVLDLSDLAAQPVVDFRKRMSEKKYEAAAKILTHELATAPDNAPVRAAKKDQEQAQRKGHHRPEMKAGMGA